MKPHVNPIDSFNLKWMPEPNSGCWLWTGCVTGAGYGRIKTGKFRMDAHRASYQFFHGKIPSGLFVLHRCDTKLCVNPDHLFLGTGVDNVQDAIQKGRAATREKHGMAKLSWSAVDKIRCADGVQWKIGRKFGITQSHVSAIKRGAFWKT